MATKIRSLINQLTSNPRKLFLIDGLGAFLTAFFLLAILARFQEYFGMPITILYFLSAAACIYMMYSICCYLFVLSKWHPYLKAITIANIIYCCVTFTLVIYFIQSLTMLGLIYFLIEIIVMSSLILLELTVLSKKL
jgi:hypothetical protein